MFCKNCGAENGETHEQCMKRQGYINWNEGGLIRFNVTERLCQFCRDLANPSAFYDSKTGEPIPMSRVAE